MTKSSLATHPRPAAPVTADPRWQRVLARDRSADGLFWYSVATTGVFCRPSCPSRPANPRNVAFHVSVQEAEAAGFRPCRRCHPTGLSTDAANAMLVEKICRLIDERDDAPSLAEMADAVELSPTYFHRLFKAATGVTPKEYAQARRAARVRDRLAAGASVTEAIYESGFGSSGRFYERSTDMLGMTPGRFRNGGDAETIRFAIGQCSLGAILVASSGKGVVAIMLGAHPDALVRGLQDQFPKARIVGGDVDYERMIAVVIGFVETPRVGLDLPLDIRGTAFQRRVWQALREIPPGATASYAAIATRIGAPRAVRAVAGACAANALAVAIPCHRVVRTDGDLSGYRWGVALKRQLLETEQTVADMVAAPPISSIARQRPERPLVPPTAS